MGWVGIGRDGVHQIKSNHIGLASFHTHTSQICAPPQPNHANKRLLRGFSPLRRTVAEAAHHPAAPKGAFLYGWMDGWTDVSSVRIDVRTYLLIIYIYIHIHTIPNYNSVSLPLPLLLGRRGLPLLGCADAPDGVALLPRPQQARAEPPRDGVGGRRGV